MTYATASITSIQITGHNQGHSCSNCNDYLESEAKFCGSCGFIVAPNSFSLSELTEQQARLLSRPSAPMDDDAPYVPSFAVPVTQPNRRVTELSDEAHKLMVLLARERIFLYFLIASFLCINLFGCWAAWTCYSGFNGDEMSKMVMASTPFLFINLVALVVIVPIKGTKKEIARLKTRLSHTQFNLEYGHLNM
jgi:hypothetical protein